MKQNATYNRERAYEKTLIKTFIIIVLTLQLSVVQANGIPSFIKKSNMYRFVVSGLTAEVKVKVIDIDESSGWVKVESTSKHFNNAWFNVQQISFIKEIL